MKFFCNCQKVIKLPSNSVINEDQNSYDNSCYARYSKFFFISNVGKYRILSKQTGNALRVEKSPQYHKMFEKLFIYAIMNI